MILKVPSLFHPLSDTQLFDDGQFFHVPFDDVLVDGMIDAVAVRRQTLGPIYGNRSGLELQSDPLNGSPDNGSIRLIVQNMAGPIL